MSRPSDPIRAGLARGWRVYGAGHYLRPSFVQPYACANVLIEGVTITNSPMWVIHPVLSRNVIVRDVKVVSAGPNNDGCDPESCRDVLVEDTVFDTGDDCIAIKSGINDDGRRVGIPSENIIIRNCVFKDGHGGVVLGSEVAGSVRNVFVENCKMDSPHLDRALRFKSNARRGGVLENVFLRNVEIGRVAEAIVRANPVQPAKALQGQLAGVNVNKVNSRPGSDYTIDIRGVHSISFSSEPLVAFPRTPPAKSWMLVRSMSSRFSSGSISIVPPNESAVELSEKL